MKGSASHRTRTSGESHLHFVSTGVTGTCCAIHPRMHSCAVQGPASQVRYSAGRRAGSRREVRMMESNENGTLNSIHRLCHTPLPYL